MEDSTAVGHGSQLAIGSLHVASYVHRQVSLGVGFVLELISATAVLPSFDARCDPYPDRVQFTLLGSVRKGIEKGSH